MTIYQPKYTERNKRFFLDTVPQTRASTNGRVYLTAPIHSNSEYNLLSLCDPEEQTDSLSSVRVTKLHFTISYKKLEPGFNTESTLTPEPIVFNTTGVFIVGDVELLDVNESITTADLNIHFDSSNLALHSRNDVNWAKVFGELKLKMHARINQATGDTRINTTQVQTLVLSDTPNLTIVITGYELQVETTNYNRRPRVEEESVFHDEAIEVSETKTMEIRVVGFECIESKYILDELRTMLESDLVEISGLATNFQTRVTNNGQLERTPLFDPAVSIHVQESAMFHIEYLMENWIDSYEDIVKHGICFYIVERNNQNKGEFLNVWKITNPYPGEFSGRDVNSKQETPVYSILLGGLLDHTKQVSDEVRALFNSVEE